MKETHVHFSFLGQDLYLLPQKAIYWSNQKCLLLSDVHLGKINHFRKAGIALPNAAIYQNFQTLDDLLSLYPTEQLIFLGDLFHSEVNEEWQLFAHWRTKYSFLKLLLVKGNHDILSDQHYEDLGIEVVPEQLLMQPFFFSHIPLHPTPTNSYNLSGHLHPGVRLQGKGGQILQLPCFYFGKKSGLLPAFGQFTGKALIRPEPNSHVFVITSERVVLV